jgi:hypothetical protein
MRYAVLLALSVFLLPSCKGEKGDTGPSGINGNANVTEYSGFVTNNDFLVFVNGNPDSYFVAVDIGDGTNYSQLPYFLPADGVNTFFLFRNGVVEIVNAQLAAATRYRIFLVARSATGSLSLFEHLTN